MNPDFPSVDAAGYYGPIFARDEQISRVRADAERRTELACRAIMSLGANVTEREVSHLVGKVMALIDKSGWSHTEQATQVNESLTDAHYVLEVAAEACEA